MQPKVSEDAVEVVVRHGSRCGLACDDQHGIREESVWRKPSLVAATIQARQWVLKVLSPEGKCSAPTVGPLHNLPRLRNHGVHLQVVDGPA